uniref:Uncharacterized protein n=1 Tax=Amblyomma cajennense TaxID=34607 RepID=A0A023FNR4_AMBCJ
MFVLNSIGMNEFYFDDIQCIVNPNECLYQFLKSPETVVLYRAPPIGWRPAYSSCLSSEFLGYRTHPREFLRSIFFYGIGLHRNDFGPVNLTVLFKVDNPSPGTTLLYALEVSNGEPAVFPDVSIGKGRGETPKMSPTPKPIPRSLQGAGHLYKEGVNVFEVLFAGSTCLLLGEPAYSATRTCTLWVLKSAVDNLTKCCKFAFFALCYPRAYEAYKSQVQTCKIYAEMKWKKMQ